MKTTASAASTRRKSVKSGTPGHSTNGRHSSLPANYEPKTELGKRLIALRTRFVANGGKTLSRSELRNEIARVRGIDE